MQVSLTTIARQVDGVSQYFVILAPLVCVRTHLPSSLLLEITPLDQVKGATAYIRRLVLCFLPYLCFREGASIIDLLLMRCTAPQIQTE